MRRFFASLLEIFEVLIIAVAAVVIVRHYLIQPFLVSGDSMVPSFQNGNYLLIDELTFRLREPERGEVVVFKFPKNETTYFIKRIIGLPGERIKVEDGKVTVFNAEHKDGLVLEEKYISEAMTSGNRDVQLGPEEYYVLGDNRPASYDSRSWGAVPQKDLVGLVRLRLWPVAEASVFQAPNFE
jgi:signal peptidase I